MKELKRFRDAFPRQAVLPRFQSYLGLPPGVDKVGPSRRELLEIIRQEAEKKGSLPVPRESVLALFNNVGVIYHDSPLGKFLDAVVDDITYSEENQV